jgi:O-antigen/teichoic acid export membrane protein
MKGVRSALLLAMADRYFGLSVNFLSLAAVSRILTPHEIGLAVIGAAICAFWFRLREFTTASYLILRKDLVLDDMRAAFTISFLLSGLLCLLLWATAGVLARVYQQQELAILIRILAFAYFLEVFPAPIIALFQRDLAFGKVALVNMTNVAITGGGTIAFAILGLGYLSAALGWLAGALTSGLLAIVLRGDLSVFRPLIRNWGAAVAFGAYNGINVFLYGAYESLPFILIGKLISVGATADFNRSLMIVQLPDKLFLAGVVAVALPAFANHVRQGNDMKRAYLEAVVLITAIQWPALLLISILAYPSVSILLGTQWLNVAPLIQIMALGYAFSFSAALNFPVLLSLGGMREILLRAVIAWPVSALIVSGAAYFGMTAVALSFSIAIGFQALVSIYFVQRHIPLGWDEIVKALRASLMVTLCTAAGALSVVALCGFRFDLSNFQGALAGLAGVAGWCFGVWIAKHALLEEIRSTIGELRELRPISLYLLNVKLLGNKMIKLLS